MADILHSTGTICHKAPSTNCGLAATTVCVVHISWSNFKQNSTLQLDLVTNPSKSQLGHLETIYIITVNATYLINQPTVFVLCLL